VELPHRDNGLQSLLLIDFVDTPGAYADTIHVEVMSKFIQIYNTRLQIHPQLFGIKSFIYHHPWISATVGVLTYLFVFSFIALTIRLNQGTFKVTSAAAVAPINDEKKEE